MPGLCDYPQSQPPERDGVTGIVVFTQSHTAVLDKIAAMFDARTLRLLTSLPGWADARL